MAPLCSTRPSTEGFTDRTVASIVLASKVVAFANKTFMGAATRFRDELGAAVVLIRRWTARSRREGVRRSSIRMTTLLGRSGRMNALARR